MTEYRSKLSDNLIFRAARHDDLPAISSILKAAVARMLAEGKQQWNESYPTEAHARADIDRGAGYVIEMDGSVVGYTAVVFDGEPAYEHLTGRWLSEGKYVVAHRMAVSQHLRGKGLGRKFFYAIEEFAKSRNVHSFKIDTNFDNFVMLGLLDSLGFIYCGEIAYQGDPRKAFEKII